MFVIPLSNVIAMMASAEEGCTFDLDLPWPLHLALAKLRDLADGSTGSELRGFEVGLVDHSGRGVPGLEGILGDLYARGVFVVDARRDRRLLLNEAERTHFRREFRRLHLDDARRLYEAARFWATASSTSSKNLPSAFEVGSITLSSPPKPLKLVAPGA